MYIQVQKLFIEKIYFYDYGLFVYENNGARMVAMHTHNVWFLV